MRDAIVIGSGLAGLVAALRLAKAGRSVTLVAKGAGGLQLSQGTIDILGYAPDRVMGPLGAVDAVASDHPYAGLGSAAVSEAVTWLRDELGPELLVGDPTVNVHLPTAVGAIRPTALAQPSMIAANAVGGLRYSVVGIKQIKDFQADLIAGNLARSTAPDGGPLSARAAWIDVPARAGEVDSWGVTYARALDDEAFAARFADAVAGVAGECDVVLLPAVLGLDRYGVWRQVSERVGRPVAEIAMQPPSIPGLRLYRALLAKAKTAGVRHIPGSLITGFASDGEKVTSVTLAAAGSPRHLAASAFVFAPGGFESGSLGVDSYGKISERVFGLPLTADDSADLIGPDYWTPQRLFQVGARADSQMRPVDATGRVIHPNVYLAGGILAGADRWGEKSGDGIAVATAVRAAESITGGMA